MKKKKKRSDKTGLAPGTLVFTGEQKLSAVVGNVIKYSETSCEEVAFDVENLPIVSDESLLWVDIRGVHNIEVIEFVGKKYGIHPLVLEDILDINQRPKFEEYGDGCFLLLRALDLDNGKIQTEQISIYFKKNLVISFQEDEGNVFDGVIQRILTSSGRIRKRGADYLAYALADNVVDHYFLLLDKVDALVEGLESEISLDPDSNTKMAIHELKREMLAARKSISPLREAVNQFSKSDHELIAEQTVYFLRDLYDHTIQVMEMVEMYRDTISGLQDLYISEISFKMNNVMQVLTIIATLFIPLTFLAGLYGMNFEYMPELTWKYSYFVFLGFSGIIFLALLKFFRNKKWL